jgi:hypothetical protein
VGIAIRPGGDGCWLATGAGRVVTAGAAAFSGDLSGGPSPPPAVVGIERAPDGAGYWLASGDGRVWGFGSAAGSVGVPPGVLPQPIVGIVAPPPRNPSTGAATCGAAAAFCYWLVGADGSVYPFNVAGYGSLPASGVSRSDVVGIAARPDGAGYWLVGSDGHVWAFGTGTPWYGDTGGYQPEPHMAIAGMGRRATGTGAGSGYFLTAVDGGVVDFGGAVYEGHERGPGWNG